VCLSDSEDTRQLYHSYGSSTSGQSQHPLCKLSNFSDCRVFFLIPKDTRQLYHSYGSSTSVALPSAIQPHPRPSQRTPTNDVPYRSTHDTLSRQNDRFARAPAAHRGSIHLGCTWIIPRPVSPPPAPIAIVIHPQCLRIHLKQSKIQSVLALSTPWHRVFRLLPPDHRRYCRQCSLALLFQSEQCILLHVRVRFIFGNFFPFRWSWGCLVLYYLVLLEKSPAIKISCTSVRCVHNHSASQWSGDPHALAHGG